MTQLQQLCLSLIQLADEVSIAISYKKVTGVHGLHQNEEVGMKLWKGTAQKM